MSSPSRLALLARFKTMGNVVMLEWLQFYYCTLLLQITLQHHCLLDYCYCCCDCYCNYWCCCLWQTIGDGLYSSFGHPENQRGGIWTWTNDTALVAVWQAGRPLSLAKPSLQAGPRGVEDEAPRSNASARLGGRNSWIMGPATCLGWAGQEETRDKPARVRVRVRARRGGRKCR